MLTASRAAIDLFVSAGTTNYTVKELASSIALNERTFYRYFPTKEEVAIPAIAESLGRVSKTMAERPADEPLPESIAAAFSSAWSEVGILRARRLVEILNSAPNFQAVYRQSVAQSEQQWRGLLAARLGIPRGSLQAALAGASITAALRLALEDFSDVDSDDPLQVLSEALNLLSQGIFTSEHS